MADEKKLDDERLVTRKELRKLGLDYSSTQYQRWEKAGKLTPVKPGGSRSSRVHYRWGQVKYKLLDSPPLVPSLDTDND
jgi:hypothetical protein